MKGMSYINELSARGEFYFTTSALAKKVSISSTAALAIIRRLKEKGQVATPLRGFHLIIPAEYQALGCLPPEQFIPDLMNYLKRPYYVGLLSAAQFYGAAHQKPQLFQVISSDNHQKIQCGKISVVFIARKNIMTLDVKKFKTTKGYLNVSTPELTALDLVNYPLSCGGLNNVVTVLEELAENIDQTALSTLIKKIKVTPQLQRLGFFFEVIDQKNLATIVEDELHQRRMNKIALVSKIKTQPNMLVNHRWKVVVNEMWESDL